MKARETGTVQGSEGPAVVKSGGRSFPGISMKIIALCHTCSLKHTMDFDPRVGPGSGFSDWLTKHPKGHRTDFRFPHRSRRDRPVLHRWMDYLHNADVKAAYAATITPTMTFASLAASSTLLAGREGTAISNASNKYLDYMAAGFFKTAASNAAAGSISVAFVGASTDTPTWPDVFDGTDSVETVSQQTIFDQVCKVAAFITTVATDAITWPFGPVCIAGLWGGSLPVQFVPFVSHNAETSTNAWSATEGDHALRLTGIFATVI